MSAQTTLAEARPDPIPACDTHGRTFYTVRADDCDAEPCANCFEAGISTDFVVTSRNHNAHAHKPIDCGAAERSPQVVDSLLAYAWAHERVTTIETARYLASHEEAETAADINYLIHREEVDER